MREGHVKLPLTGNTPSPEFVNSHSFIDKFFPLPYGEGSYALSPHRGET